MIEGNLNTKLKSKNIAYLLWLLGIFGCLGLHRLYLGKKRSGFLWMFTAGLVGFGGLSDLFILHILVESYNARITLPALERDLEKIKSLKNKFAGEKHYEAAVWYRNKEILLISQIEKQKRVLKMVTNF